MGISEENRHLEDADRRCIWHPFTQMQEWLSEKPIIITEGRDCFLRDISGRWYMDGVSSLWVNIFGHRRKEIDDAVRSQLDRIAHSTLLGLSNVPAVRLAERLVTLLSTSFPSRERRLLKVFYSDNGSTSVEVALKMAFQYWQHRGLTGKTRFVGLRNAYHGDTLGAVSVGGIDIFHKTFEPLLFRAFRAPSPYCYRCELGLTWPGCGLACIEKTESILRKHRDEIAGFIIEPVVQAAGGMIVSPPGYLAEIRRLCSRYNVLMIADEVATGFGRTGRMFACEHDDVVPDMICLSKGLTGGYLPLAATVVTQDVFDAFLGEFGDLKTFFHGHSFTGNPLACAAALATLDIFGTENVLEDLQPKADLLTAWLASLSSMEHVGNVRGRGLMAGVELVRDKGTKEPYAWEEKMGWKVAYLARDNGVLIRPLGNVVVIMPPLTITTDNLRELLRVIGEAIRAATA